MTRRMLFGISLAALLASGLAPPAASAAEKAGPLKVVYYYIPG
jgi:hypothetical protein